MPGGERDRERDSSLTFLHGGRRSSNPTAFSTACARFAPPTTSLRGGLCHFSDCDCGKNGDIVKHALRMAAKRGLECKICRYGGGVCQPGFRKTHVREDPECRLHGQLGRCTRPAQPLLPAPPMPAAAESPPEVALDRKTQFATPGGLHLLYDPEDLDRWIPRKVEPAKGEDMGNGRSAGANRRPLHAKGG